MPTSRLNNETRRYNYPDERVYDEAGQIIKPGVSTYGPRGLRPWYLFDEDGALVELTYLKKVNLYKEKRTAPVATQLALIDERLADLTFDAKKYLISYSAAAKNEAETKKLLDTIPNIAGMIASTLGLPAVGGVVAGAVRLLMPDYFEGSLLQKYQSKVNTLEKEANYLIITKNKLTGEYARQAAAGQIDLTDESQVYENQTLSEVVSRQANTDLIPGLSNDTLLYLFIGLFLLIILRKRRKKKK